MTFLSVIIPTYNSEKTIERCLNSLICQTFKNFEVCIVDNKSLDKTLSKASNFYSDFNDIKAISEPDKGVYDAMNKGIDIARGDWLYFLGSDDEVFDKDVFSDIFNTAVLKSCEIIYGNAYVHHDTSWAKAGQVYDGPFNIRKLISRNICHQAIFYRKELFERFGKYKLQYYVCADWELNLRLFPKTESIYINRIIANFYSGGLSTTSKDDLIEDDIKFLKQQALKSYILHRITSFLGLHTGF